MEDGGKLASQPAPPDGRVFVEELGPDMVVEAPKIGPMGRKAATVDLKRVEELAALGMKPVVIGPAMGFTVSKFRGLFERRAAVRDAYDRGNAKWQEMLLLKVTEGVAAGGNPALLIFSLKQMHGAGWSDNVKVTQENPVNTDAHRKFVEWQKQKRLKESAPKMIPGGPVEDAAYTSAE